MNIRKLPLAALVTGLLGYSGVLLAGSYAPASPIVLPDDLALSPAVTTFRSFRSQGEFEELKESEPVDSAPRNSVKVDDDGAQCPDAAFTTIQGAVDAGANFIEICAGLYPENVVIGTGLRTKLLGHGTGSTTVTGVAGTAGPIIDVSGGGQTNIEGLTVDGGSAMAGGVVTGIRYDASDGKIKDVEVLNIRDASGSSQGIGIRVQSTEGVPTRIKVVKTLVQNYSRGGIDGNGMGVHLAVNRSDIVGPVAPTVWAPNGIQVSRGAKDRIVDNVVDNNEIALSGATDAVDGTLGLGTAGTANTWQRNDCTTSNPAGLCD